MGIACKGIILAGGSAQGTSSSGLITFVIDRPGHDRRYAIDCGEAECELGFAPQVRIADGLDQTLQWYLANQAWWSAILDGSYQRSNSVP